MNAAPAVSFVNAELGGRRSSLRVCGAHIAGVHVPPQRGDLVVDLNGDRLLPGLINAHDHLQLNNFPSLTYPAFYRNAGEWIADFNARLRGNPAVTAAAAVPRTQRFLGGGLKNLLSGVTTVVHHDPLDAALLATGFPTRVPAGFGWAHSLEVDGEEGVRAACERTAPDVPWIIHAAEGIDAQAHAEFDRLEALGCVRPNTLLVHALALDAGQRGRLAARGAGVIWCPSSNLRLFGRTADIRDLVALGRVALGTDSRLTAANDLLGELRVAHECLQLPEASLERLVTMDSARLLRLADCGSLAAGLRADLLVLPAGLPLSAATRADVRLVMLAGAARYGEQPYLEALRASAACTPLLVDGRPKLLQRELAASLVGGLVSEPGVTVPAAAGRAACA
jgi:cytosine/adenosine deaminase-related metal-dependent hydrolase